MISKGFSQMGLEHTESKISPENNTEEEEFVGPFGVLAQHDPFESITHSKNPWEVAETLIVEAIAVRASPSLGGEVRGSFEAILGETVTVTAVPALGYAFKNWTEGGFVVSTLKGYSFTADQQRTLVANFVPVESTIEPGEPLEGIRKKETCLAYVQFNEDNDRVARQGIPENHACSQWRIAETSKQYRTTSDASRLNGLVESSREEVLTQELCLDEDHAYWESHGEERRRKVDLGVVQAIFFTLLVNDYFDLTP